MDPPPSKTSIARAWQGTKTPQKGSAIEEQTSVMVCFTESSCFRYENVRYHEGLASCLISDMGPAATDRSPCKGTALCFNCTVSWVDLCCPVA